MTQVQTSTHTLFKKIMPIAFLIISALLFFWTLLYLFQDQMIFPRSAAPSPLGQIPYPNAVVMETDHQDGRTEAWFIPAPNASAANPAPVVLCFHGNAEIIDYQDWFVQNYTDMGFSLLLIEYRGYGRADGIPSESGILKDSLEFHRQLLERDDVDPSKIIYHGRSLGGGVAAALAAERPPKAMILQSTFSSMASMAFIICSSSIISKKASSASPSCGAL